MPDVLTSCAEFIEKFGIVDGIYRLSGVTSNIQRLRYVLYLNIYFIQYTNKEVGNNIKHSKHIRFSLFCFPIKYSTYFL